MSSLRTPSLSIRKNPKPRFQLKEWYVHGPVTAYAGTFTLHGKPPAPGAIFLETDQEGGYRASLAVPFWTDQQEGARIIRTLEQEIPGARVWFSDAWAKAMHFPPGLVPGWYYRPMGSLTVTLEGNGHSPEVLEGVIDRIDALGLFGPAQM